MRAGLRRHRLMFERKVTAADDTGQPNDEYLPTVALYAHVKPLTGREAIETGRQVSEVSHLINTRYSADVTAAGRFREESTGRVFNLTKAPVNVGERNRELVCDCIERV